MRYAIYCCDAYAWRRVIDSIIGGARVLGKAASCRGEEGEEGSSGELRGAQCFFVGGVCAKSKKQKTK